MNIRDLVAQGLSNSAIAARLGVHPSTITRRLRAQGLTNLKLAQRRRCIQDLRRAGWTPADIARHQGVSRDVVYKDLRHLTEPNKDPGQTGKPA